MIVVVIVVVVCEDSYCLAANLSSDDHLGFIFRLSVSKTIQYVSFVEEEG